MYILNFYEKRKTKYNRYNVGDLASAPFNYFNFPGFENIKLNFQSNYKKYPKNSHIIFGGGSVLSLHKKTIRKHLDYFTGKKIIWGAGGSRVMHIPFNKFDLIGCREFNFVPSDLFLPCASCMHPFFDNPPKPSKTSFVLYEGHKRPLHCCTLDTKNTLVNSLKELNYKLKFLASARKCILTSSYHGAYWSLLLNKRITIFGAIPIIKKILTLKYFEPFDGMLKEFRELNNNFYKKVIELIT